MASVSSVVASTRAKWSWYGARVSNMQRNFKLAEDGYSANVLQLSVAGRYIERLIGNRRVAKYLAQHHADIFNELSHVIEDRALSSL